MTLVQGSAGRRRGRKGKERRRRKKNLGGREEWRKKNPQSRP